MLNIIHETKDIIIVNKPAGQLSQGAKGFDLDLVSEVMTYNASQESLICSNNQPP